MKSKIIVILVFLVILLSAIIGMIFMKSNSSDKNTQSSSSETSKTSITESTDKADASSSVSETSSDSESTAAEETTEDNFGSGDSFNGTEPVLRKMGEELPVDLLAPREQGDKPPTNKEAFGYWSGKMTFKVNSAVLYNDLESSGISSDQTVIDYGEYSQDGYKPLVINMTISNINATANYGSTFYSDIFMLSSKDEFVNEDFLGDKTFNDWKYNDKYLAYYSAHSDGDDYYSFNINQGESMDVTFCYYVKTDTISTDNLYLGLVTYSYCHSFGIALDKLEVQN